MSQRRFLHGARFWGWVTLLLAYSAGAVGVFLVDTHEDRYRNLSQVKLTTVDSPADQRRAGASQTAAVYRAQSGMPFSTLPAGSSLQILWPDGSAETVMILDPTSPLGSEPLQGSQLRAEQTGAR
jgi:threonine dehydrogenase-like Zn-dependent dehydrogenase